VPGLGLGRTPAPPGAVCSSPRGDMEMMETVFRFYLIIFSFSINPEKGTKLK
jgi:hypothetical protein